MYFFRRWCGVERWTDGTFTLTIAQHSAVFP